MLDLDWSRSRGSAGHDLFAIDLEAPDLKDLDGVYILWHGGAKPHVVKVGQGRIRDRIMFHRADVELAPYKEQKIYISWAKVELAARDGVERFLIENTHPRVKGTIPATAAIECSLPGRKQPKPGAAPEPTGIKPVGAPVPEPTAFKPKPAAAPEPVAPKAAAALPGQAARRTYSNTLQKRLDQIIKGVQPQAKGFFGGQAAAAPKSEDVVVDVVKLLLDEAVRCGCSDIHLEPKETHLRVRFRIDGILEEMVTIPHSANLRVVSHIRVRCGLDPEQSMTTGKPQDGRMAVVVDGQPSDLRLSTFPTTFGEKAVLRIIQRSTKLPSLEELGLRPQILELVQRIISRPQGMIVLTGPAGSGKSTTLYALLETLDNPTRNIVTLEDPIERTLPGLTQAALQPKVGFTFAEGLRSILRQDPNVIMVGEIRDKETVEIAMSAALTGHLLFTTLHTNSALDAVARMLDMGHEPFLIAAALSAVFAQRLARRLCPKCREAYTPQPTELNQLKELATRAQVPLPEGLSGRLYRAVGCAACRQTGFSGRALILEVINMSPALRQLILRKAPVDEMRKTAAAEGTVTLLMDGLDKVAQGITTVDELVRVVGGE